VAATLFERLHQPHLQADAVITRTKARAAAGKTWVRSREDRNDLRARKTLPR